MMAKSEISSKENRAQPANFVRDMSSKGMAEVLSHLAYELLWVVLPKSCIIHVEAEEGEDDVLQQRQRLGSQRLPAGGQLDGMREILQHQICDPRREVMPLHFQHALLVWLSRAGVTKKRLKRCLYLHVTQLCFPQQQDIQRKSTNT